MPFTLQFGLAIVLLVAEWFNVAQVAEGAQEFKRCYNNTSEEESHCFDVQYEANNQPLYKLYTSFEGAQRRCKGLNSTLVIIENEKVGNLIQQFMSDTNNPFMGYYFWLNAYQVNEFDNTYYRWHWLNTTLPNLPESAVSYTYDSGWYTAVLEFRNDKSQFVLTAKQPHSTFYYVCEYSVSNCSSANSNDVRLMNGRCYRAVQELVTYYEARNKCLKGGGDLASFANVTSINFTSWLGSNPNAPYWIGLRFIWYTWGDSGQELKYTNWATNGDLQKPCLIFCFNCIPNFTWSSRNCNTDYNYVVCHTITSLKMTTTSTTATVSTTQTTNLPATMSTLTMATFARKEESIKSSIIPVAVGVGVGVGVPVIVGIVVIAICVFRKRRHETVSSAQSTNRYQRETSIDQPFEAQTENERDEIGETAYGTVVPSMLSRQEAEANGAHSATEQTVYAPLQIL